MAFGTWTDGNQLGASDLNNKIAQMLFVDKPSDESVTSSTTQQNDNHLFFSTVASTNYMIRTYIMVSGASGAGNGIEFGWYGPSGATFDWCSDSEGSGAGSGAGQVSRTKQSIGSLPDMDTTGTSNFHLILAIGILKVSTTAGTFGFRWAQSTSNATATTVKALSGMVVTKLV